MNSNAHRATQTKRPNLAAFPQKMAEKNKNFPKQSNEQVYGTVGTIAVALGRVVDGSAENRWKKQTLELIVLKCFQLDGSRIDALWPLTISTDVVDPEPFSTMVKENHRSEIMIGLVWALAAIDGYDARTRTLFRYVASFLNVPWKVVVEEEVKIGMFLYNAHPCMEKGKGVAYGSSSGWKRSLSIGAAAATGATLLAITGGAAAPILATGFAAFGSSGVAISTALGSAGGIAATTAAFGATGAGLVGSKVDRRTAGLKTFEFKLAPGAGNELPIFITISGWLVKEKKEDACVDFYRPWGDIREFVIAFYQKYDQEAKVDALLEKCQGKEALVLEELTKTYGSKVDEMKNAVDDGAISDQERRAWVWGQIIPNGDHYYLQWETQVLERFGNAMSSYVSSKAIDYAKTEVIKHSMFAALYAAVALPASVVKIANMIDGPWTIALQQAIKAGKVLAKILAERDQGQRPVTLIGYSMGARVIYYCLRALRDMGKDAAFGIVENAVLLGLPVSAGVTEWEYVRPVVSGRLINGYSKNDWMLAMMYRYQDWAITVSGIAPVETKMVENADLSDIISGHMQYKNKMRWILNKLKLES